LPDPMPTASASEIPAEVTATKELLDPAVLDQSQREDPFQSLVAPKEEAAPLQPVANATPTVNPLGGYTLSGIIYRGSKNSLAILGTPAGKSKVVHLGQILEGDGPGGSVEVSSISKTSVILSILGASSDMPEDARSTTLKLASLIGYKSTKSSGPSGKAPAPNPTGTAAVPPPANGGGAPGAPGGAPATAAPSGLPEIQAPTSR
jgi:hypothetical protein